MHRMPQRRGARRRCEADGGWPRGSTGSLETPSPPPSTDPQAKAARIALPAGPAIALLRAALEPRSSLLPDAARPSGGGQPTLTTPLGRRRSAATPASPPGTADALGLGLSSLGLSSPPPPQQQAAASVMSPPGASKGSGSAPPASDPFLHFSITGLLASSPGLADECARIATLSVAAASREPLASPPPLTTRLRSLADQVREPQRAAPPRDDPSNALFAPEQALLLADLLRRTVTGPLQASQSARCAPPLEIRLPLALAVDEPPPPPPPLSPGSQLSGLAPPSFLQAAEKVLASAAGGWFDDGDAEDWPLPSDGEAVNPEASAAGEGFEGSHVHVLPLHPSLLHTPEALQAEDADARPHNSLLLLRACNAPSLPRGDGADCGVRLYAAAVPLPPGASLLASAPYGPAPGARAAVALAARGASFVHDPVVPSADSRSAVLLLGGLTRADVKGDGADGVLRISDGGAEDRPGTWLLQLRYRDAVYQAVDVPAPAAPGAAPPALTIDSLAPAILATLGANSLRGLVTHARALSPAADAASAAPAYSLAPPGAPQSLSAYEAAVSAVGLSASGPRGCAAVLTRSGPLVRSVALWDLESHDDDDEEGGGDAA